MEKKVLIISYVFPPYPGIGGRRWAKFAKHLAKEGYTVHVLSARNPFDKESLFTNDINYPNIYRHHFKSLYPTVLTEKPVSLNQKVRYRFFAKLLSLVVKGYIYDKAALDEKRVLSTAKQIISRHQIKNVIVTGAPFRLNYYSTKLKNEQPELNLINDFRDPWTWANAWGNAYNHLKPAGLKFELDMQQEVIRRSNIITVPVEPMQKHLTESYPQHTGKIKILPHAFDEDEIVSKKEYRKNSYRCVFFGAIYTDIEIYFEKLSKLVAQGKGRVTLDIYSESNKNRDIVIKNGAEPCIQYKEALQGRNLFKVLSEYDYAVFIYPDFVKDFLSTKFYETIQCRLPILFFGEKGGISEFLTQNKLGICFDKENLEEKFQRFTEGKTEFNYNDSYAIDRFSYSVITKELSQYFV